MRRLVLAAFAAAALLWGFSGNAAHAQGCGPQNPNCVVPTAPPGTSNNQAASTAFVQSTVTANSLIVGTAVVTGGTANCLLYDNAGALGCLATANTSILGTNGSGVPGWQTSIACSFLPALTGDVTSSLGGCATAIAAGVVTNAKLATMPANTVKCNNTGGAATPTDCTVPQLLVLSAILPNLQGKFEFVNDTSTFGMAVIAYNGNGLVLYCPATTAWNLFPIPSAPVTISNVANNGSGAYRITHAVTSPPYITGQYVFTSGIGGNTNINSSTPAIGPWKITVISPTQFDLVGSTFGGAYTSGGQLNVGIYWRADNLTINAVANQAMANATTYLVGAQYLDAGCTQIQFVAQTALNVPNMDPVMGFNTLTGYTNTPLLGMVYKDATLGIQGNGSSELLTSWYNRNMVGLGQTFTGNTGGTLNSPIAMTNAGGAGGVMRWLNYSDLSPDITCTFNVTTTAAANIAATVNVTGANTFSGTQTIRHAGTGAEQIVIHIPVEAQNAGAFSLAVTLQTDAGTATLGATANSTCGVYTNF